MIPFYSLYFSQEVLNGPSNTEIKNMVPYYQIKNFSKRKRPIITEEIKQYYVRVN